MWDEPQALFKLSNTLFGIAAVLLLVGGLHYALRLPLFALRVVQLDVPPRQVNVTGVAAVVRNSLRGNFFTIDLAQTRRDFEKLPWVRKVDVRRHFPWRLDVELQEQVALARWNDTKLLNTHGEVFAAPTDQALPSLSGPVGSAAEVAQRYARFSGMLASLGQHISELDLSSRGAWKLRLQNGLTVKLGRQQVEQRLARFVAVYPYSLAKMQQPANYVDLRYRNGFAAHLQPARG